MKLRLAIALLLMPVAAPSAANAQAASEQDLAKNLADPVSSLISVPFQYNFDCCFRPSDAERHLLNIQPVIPTKLNADWNLVIRTILPVVYLESPAPGLDSAFGLGDTLQRFFFVPNNSPGGLTWGVGPAAFPGPTPQPALRSARLGSPPHPASRSGWKSRTVRLAARCGDSASRLCNSADRVSGVERVSSALTAVRSSS